MPGISALQDLRSPLDAAVFDRSREEDTRNSFASVLGKTQQRDGEDPATKARQTAESFVSITFIQPLLKQLRESNHTPAPFGPSEGEKQFQGLMDAELAQRVVKAAHFPLVERITGDLMKRSGRSAGGMDAPGKAPESVGQATEQPEAT
jgi:Rod binding domain-containing protein